MQYLILLLWSVHVVDTEMFVRSHNSMLDQILNNKQSRSLLDCASICDIMDGCNAFNFTTSEQRCLLANGIKDNVTFDGTVYAYESVVSTYVSLSDILGLIQHLSDIETLVLFQWAMFVDNSLMYKVNISLLFRIFTSNRFYQFL